jgi:hypothetical protein
MAADVDDGAYEDDKKRPPWLIPAIVGGVVTLGIVALFAMRGSDDDKPPPPKPVAAQQEEIPPPPPPAPPAPVAPVVAPAVTIDAQVAEVSIDAPVVAAVTIDAAPVVAAVVVDAAPPPPPPVDAAVPHVPADAAVKHVEPPKPPPVEHVEKPKPPPVEHVEKPKPPKPPAPPKDERTIEQLVDAGEYGKANTACATNTQFSTPRLVACEMAACQTKSTALAARWIRALPGGMRDDLKAKCKALGVDLDAQ